MRITALAGESRAADPGQRAPGGLDDAPQGPQVQLLFQARDPSQILPSKITKPRLMTWPLNHGPESWSPRSPRLQTKGCLLPSPGHEPQQASMLRTRGHVSLS